MVQYEGCSLDPDVNCFSVNDIEDLTLAGIGTVFKVVVGFIALIVLIVIVSFLVNKFIQLKQGAGRLSK